MYIMTTRGCYYFVVYILLHSGSTTILRQRYVYQDYQRLLLYCCVYTITQWIHHNIKTTLYISGLPEAVTILLCIYYYTVDPPQYKDNVMYIRTARGCYYIVVYILLHSGSTTILRQRYVYQDYQRLLLYCCVYTITQWIHHNIKTTLCIIGLPEAVTILLCIYYYTVDPPQY